MSNESGSNNRNKVLFGFGAVVAVLIAAILLWPSNFRKEDASGAIGAVQKHHAPQITQQDVVLGGEQVKAQQKILYTDFREDAGKLRALANESNAAARQAFAREIGTRALGVAQQAARTANRAELNAMIANKSALSAEEANTFASRLGQVDDAQIQSRINAISLDANLNDEALAQRLGAMEANLQSIDRAMEVAAQRGYLGALAEEEAVMSRATLNAADLEALASRLESRATANEELQSAQEAQLASRLADVEATVGTRYNSAAMMNNTVRGNISQAASRLQQRAALAKTMSRAVNARSN